MPRTANQRSRRTHQLGGCNNCRKRHTKCDQVRPKCLTCQAFGLDCQGYTPTVQWIHEDVGAAPIAEPKSGTRQHLYSEQARQSMSTQLVDQVEPQSLDTSLAEIDLWSGRGRQEPSDGLAVGPFSVIDLSNTEPPSRLLPIESLDNIDPGPRIPDTPSTSTLDASNSLPDYLQWSDLFDLDFNDWLSQQPDDFGIELHDEYAPTIAKGAGQPRLSLTISTITPPTTEIDDADLKKEAPTLIKHFTDDVISAVAPLPFKTKSPYKILNVCAAVQTYADLTYLGRQVKHASAANLYGLLACSAYHLGSNSPGSSVINDVYWNSLANKAGMKAKEHLQRSLQTEVHGDQKAKYKDQLMALMSTLTYVIAAGYQNDARCYMVDAERLLRLRGLGKKHISRRARLLHHMYTWYRIVGESTFVLHDGKPTTTLQSRTPFPKDHIKHNEKLDDFLRVEQADDTDEAYMDDPKAPEVGLYDIHLEDPRNDPGSMYLHIYGLPEQWLSLLSQTTRLANFSDLCKGETNIQRSLERKATRLEDMICTFVLHSNADSNDATTLLQPTQYMLRALNSALVIYFYRRIRNVNALILQSHVDDVIHALHQFDSSLAQQNVQGPGTAWPAFIAGCEASPGSRREALLKWVEAAFSKTGFQTYTAAKEMMQEVWISRDRTVESQRPSRSAKPTKASHATSWMEISRIKQKWVIVC